MIARLRRLLAGRRPEVRESAGIPGTELTRAITRALDGI